jgi:secreted PhoX family phosphatase
MTTHRQHDDDGRAVNPSDNATFAAVLSRREMLRGAAAGLVVVAASGLRRPAPAEAQSTTGFTSVVASNDDKVIVPAGYRHAVLLSWGDPVFPNAPQFDLTAQTAAKQSLQFGNDADFIGYLALPMGSDSSTRGLLGVNHENSREMMWPGWDGKHESKTRVMVETEIAAHGFTVVEVARAADGSWSVVKGSRYNRRITGATPIAIRGPAAGHALMRTKADPAGTQALGTLNNCAGGVTPWGTFLTGEENIQNYFRGKLDVVPDPALQTIHKRYGIGNDRGRYMTWGRDHERFDLAKDPNEPNRFGWVVEIDPYEPTSTPVKHTALGRMAHEGATVIVARDGRPVVYMGDDARFEYLYKFVAAGRVDAQSREVNLRLLDRGTLYAARFQDDGTGEWLPLVHGQGPLTDANGLRSQAEVVIAARRAADLVGATKMDRPEDVEPNWKTGKVYAVMTGNENRKPEQVDKANPRANVKFGHIVELTEDGGDHTATRFRWEMFILAGDPKNPAHRATYQGRTDVDPFGMPDNLAFDDAGRMWVATDGNDDTLGPNDGVWMVETEGAARGRARQFLSGPVGAEVCGPAFTPDNRTFFVAMQHPGLTEKAPYDQPSSRFPDYRADVPPRASVVVVYRADGGKIGT